MPLPSCQGTREGQVCYLDVTSLLPAARPQLAEVQEIHILQRKWCGVEGCEVSALSWKQAANSTQDAGSEVLQPREEVGLGPLRIWH